MKTSRIVVVAACALTGCATSKPSDAPQKARAALLATPSATSLISQFKPVQTFLASVDRSATSATFDSQLQKATSGDPQLAPDTDKLYQALQQSFLTAVSQCNTVLDAEAGDVNGGRNAALAIEIVGALAGAIAVPALAAGHAATALIAGVGGISGVANTLQNTVKTVGYDANSQYAAREKLRQAAIKDAEDYQTEMANYPRTAYQLAGTIDHLRAVCAFAPISAPATDPAVPGHPSS